MVTDKPEIITTGQKEDIEGEVEEKYLGSLLVILIQGKVLSFNSVILLMTQFGAFKAILNVLSNAKRDMRKRNTPKFV